MWMSCSRHLSLGGFSDGVLLIRLAERRERHAAWLRQTGWCASHIYECRSAIKSERGNCSKGKENKGAVPQKYQVKVSPYHARRLSKRKIARDVRGEDTGKTKRQR
jgi:hypothetical protein